MHARVERPLYGGAFVTDTGAKLELVLPGERVQTDAAGLTVLEPVPGRVEPGCIHFGSCGGCQYQHADYPLQVEWKRTILTGLLRGAGLGEVPEVEALAAEPWGYRNRVRLRVGTVDGVLRVGYSRRGSHAFLPVSMCPIAAPVLWRAAETLVRLAAENEVCRRWLGAAVEVELFCTTDERRVQIQLFLADAAEVRGLRFAAFCEAVHAALPELAGAGARLDQEAGRRARKAWAGEAWGAPGLACEVNGRSYWVSRGAFFQVNRFLLGAFVERVCEGESGALAWDLYAGVGLFSRVLAERFGRVVAVEGGEVAAADLAVAARQFGFEARREAALDFLRAQEHQRERPGLVVLDPPRAGLGSEGAAVLGRIGAARVVYVSCDPETLARDLAVLAGAGYRLERVTMVDLFPQTFHLETVVRLRRD